MPNITLIFRGQGRNTFGWSASDGRHADHDDGGAGVVRAWVVDDGKNRIIVTGVYGCGAGCWAVGLGPVEENDPLPRWRMRWRFEDYSTVLELEVQSGTSPYLIAPKE